MIGRVAAIGAVLAGAAVVETSLFPYVTLGGFRPDLLLLVTVGFALRDGAAAGARIGFAAGLLSDLLLGQSPVGLSALVLTGAGYAVGLFRPYLDSASVTAPVAAAALSGVAATAVYGLVSRLLGDQRFTPEVVVEAAVLVAVYNALLSPLVVAVVARVARRAPTDGAQRLPA